LLDADGTTLKGLNKKYQRPKILQNILKDSRTCCIELLNVQVCDATKDHQ
jgi:hypothetical protein